MNTVQLKRELRAMNKRRKSPYPDHMSMVPVWGGAARKLCRNLLGYSSKRRAWAHFHPITMGQMIVRVVLGEVGVRENPPGSNDGPRIRIYQAVTGAFKQAWCGSFNGWGILDAARRLGKHIQLAVNHAYVPNITEMIRKGERGWHEVGFANARGGDTVTLWGSGHVETVISRDGDWLNTVGGNTSPVGQNTHGGCVSKARRHRSEVTVIGRAW